MTHSEAGKKGAAARKQTLERRAAIRRQERARKGGIAASKAADARLHAELMAITENLSKP